MPNQQSDGARIEETPLKLANAYVCYAPFLNATRRTPVEQAPQSRQSVS
jgi:hypothetical protein